MKKIISIIIASIMTLGAFSLLAGCSKTKYDPNNFLPTGTAENPYQIVKEKVTIKIFVPRGGSNPHFNDMKMFKKLSEITNLAFDFIEVDTSSYSQVRSTAWEDKKNLPDLFLFNNSVAEQVIYAQFGAMTPFNDPNLSVDGMAVGSLIDNYMPTYKALMEDNFNIDTTHSAKEIATFEDGNMYSTLNVSDVPRDLTFKMFINEQWLNNLREDGRKMSDGSVIPTANEIKTVEQYIDILRLFKKYDVNRNGKDSDEIPVTAKDLTYLRNFILAAYGYVYPSVEITNDASEIVYVPGTDAYKKYLETMNILYTEGLLDQETFSMKTDSQMAIKGLEGRLGSFVSAAAYITVGMDKESQYVTFGPITSEYYNGDPLQWGFSNFIPSGAVIPTGTPYVREIARFLDIMYSDLGCQLIAYGEEDVDWTWDDENKTSWTFNVPADWKGSQEDYRATITPNVGTGSALYWNYDFVGKMNDPIITKLNRMSERYTPYLKQPVPEEIKMTEKEYNDIELISASIESYIKSAEYDFIVGKKNINSNWDAYLSNLVKYRSNDLTKIYNDAYNRYKK